MVVNTASIVLVAALAMTLAAASFGQVTEGTESVQRQKSEADEPPLIDVGDTVPELRVMQGEWINGDPVLSPGYEGPTALVVFATVW